VSTLEIEISTVKSDTTVFTHMLMMDDEQ